MHIAFRPIDDIKPYDKNPRVNDDAVDSVARSLQEFGWRQPVVVDGTGPSSSATRGGKRPASSGWSRCRCTLPKASVQSRPAPTASPTTRRRASRSGLRVAADRDGPAEGSGPRPLHPQLRRRGADQAHGVSRLPSTAPHAPGSTALWSCSGRRSPTGSHGLGHLPRRPARRNRGQARCSEVVGGKGAQAQWALGRPGYPAARLRRVEHDAASPGGLRRPHTCELRSRGQPDRHPVAQRAQACLKDGQEHGPGAEGRYNRAAHNRHALTLPPRGRPAVRAVALETAKAAEQFVRPPEGSLGELIQCMRHFAALRPRGACIPEMASTVGGCMNGRGSRLRTVRTPSRRLAGSHPDRVPARQLAERRPQGRLVAAANLRVETLRRAGTQCSPALSAERLARRLLAGARRTHGGIARLDQA